MIAQMVRGLAVALLLTLGLEVVHGLQSPWSGPVERLLGLEPALLAIGVLLVWAFIVFLHALTNRFWLAAGIVTSAAAVIAIADFLKLEFRGEPLFLTDAAYLSEVGFLIENVGAGTSIALLSLLLAAPLLGWAIARSPFVRNLRRRRRPPAETPAPTRGRRAAWLRVASGAAALTVILTAGTFNWPGSPARALYEAAGATWRPWNQLQNYEDNGVIAGLLYTLPASAMDEPEGYTEAAMDELVERYSERAAELNAERDEAALADTNIVVVLSETLSDPLRLPDITAEEDPIPFLRELMASHPSGTLVSSGYGGGTANMEFEVLTGMAVSNMQAQVDSPFQSVVANEESFPSHLVTLGAPEREAIAIHPYEAKFYRRWEVYPALGFERWAFREDLPHLGKLPGDRHVSDSALFEEVLRELRASEGPMFVNAVSMQNHSPQQGLADPIAVNGPLSAAQAETAGQYLRGLKHSDDALRELVDDLAELDERTIVLLYGDHLPSTWPREILDAGGDLARYETPWVVFANFPLVEVASPDPIGANQLMNQVLDAAAAPHTPWTALLHDVAGELPVMERTAWLDARGRVVSAENLTGRALDLLADYQLAQFDLVSGEGWATETLLAPAEQATAGPTTPAAAQPERL
nr:sulfatase-like hydrolase/transferase [Actinomycetales bacterium]